MLHIGSRKYILNLHKIVELFNFYTFLTYLLGIVGFEVYTAVFMKSIIFWDMTLCSPSSFNRRFGGTYRLHLQGGKIGSAKTSKQAGGKLNLFIRP
jgi:hypothetical protein